MYRPDRKRQSSFRPPVATTAQVEASLGCAQHSMHQTPTRQRGSPTPSQALSAILEKLRAYTMYPKTPPLKTVVCCTRHFSQLAKKRAVTVTFVASVPPCPAHFPDNVPNKPTTATAQHPGSRNHPTDLQTFRTNPPNPLLRAVQRQRPKGRRRGPPASAASTAPRAKT